MIIDIDESAYKSEIIRLIEQIELFKSEAYKAKIECAVLREGDRNEIDRLHNLIHAIEAAISPSQTPLTDDAICALFISETGFTLSAQDMNLMEFARAIEAVHGIGVNK